MAFPILGTPKPYFLDTSGFPLVGGTITVLDPNTDQTKSVYGSASDADTLTVPITSDITLDVLGQPSEIGLWGRDGEDYRVIIRDASGTNIYTLDKIRVSGHSHRAKVVLAATTSPSIIESEMFDLNSDITSLSDGGVGDVIYVTVSGNAYTVTHDASQMLLANKTTPRLQIGDTLTLAMLQDQVWTEIGRTYGGLNASTPNKFKTADEVLTTTNFADDTHLSAWTLPENQFYRAEGYLFVTSDALTQDIKMVFTSTSVHQASGFMYFSVDEDGATGTTVTGKGNWNGTTSVTIDILAGKTVGIHIIGFIRSNASTAPLVDLQVAQGTVGGTTTLKNGSWLSIEQMGQ